MIAPSVAVVIWGAEQPLTVWYAANSFKEISVDPDDLDRPQRVQEMKRAVQSHFLDYHIYIPVEDMLIRYAIPEDDQYFKQGLAKLCGRGIMFVWIPLSFKLPFWGEQTLEWCWKPEIRRTTGRIAQP